jgi:filamentous hemagglutinin family protein
MSRVSSNSARRARSVAAAPAAGFRPAGAALAVAAAFVLHPAMLHAQPSGGQVIHGHAGFASSGNNLVITTLNGAGTNHSAINWQSFSIPAGSMTQFIQPSAASTSINRVLGNNPSAIFGTLRSNGKLVLVNPAGIAVGAGAVVDTAGFTASTLKMTEADALAGRLNFAGDAAGLLQVDGRIVARNGDVVLIGPQVQVGAGTVVQSIGGATVLAAGQKVVITGRGLEGIHLEVQAGNEARNLGTLQGDAVGMFAHTLRHSGIIEAQAVTADGGKVVLKAMGGDAMVDGAIKAAAGGGRGGQVDVLGHRVGLLAGASIDASAANGGGQVRIGGDYQGANADVPNAAFTYVDAAATINADATEQGNGGRVIVWADDATRMHGQISARGGSQGGDGGFAEVSGKQYLEFTGRADLRAPNGATGTLLLDPNDIIIDVAGPTDTSIGAVFAGGPAVAHIKESDLEAQLELASVIVATNGDTSGGTGRITIESGVNLEWGTGAVPNSNVLGLQADKDIVLRGSITAGANNAVSMRAFGGGVVQDAATSVVKVGSLMVEAQGGGVSMDGNNLVDRLAAVTSGPGNNFSFKNAKSLTIGAVATPYGAARSGIQANDGTSLGSVNVRTTSGSLTVLHNTDSAIPSYPHDINAGSVLLQAAGDVDFVGGADILSNGSSIKVLAGGSVLGDGWFSSGGSTDSSGAAAAISLTASTGSVSFAYLDAGQYYRANGLHGGNVTVNAATSVTAGSIYADGAYNISATGGNAGMVQVNAGGSIALDFVSASGGYSTEASIESAAGNGGKAGSIALSGAAGVVANSLQAWGGSSYGSSLPAGAGMIGGSVSASSSSGSVAVQYIDVSGGSGSVAANAGAVSISAAGNVQVSDVYAVGGYSSGNGAGGQGGTVSVVAGGNLVLTPFDGSFAVNADGGDAGLSGGGTGGRGGSVTLKMGGTLTVSPQAGEASASSGFLPSGTSGVTASGGWGGDSSGTGGTGGAGGSVRVERTGGPLVLDGTVALAAVGGDGGYGMGTTGLGGAGGAGGTIDLVAGGGAVILRSPLLHAEGGLGGWHADESGTGATGALGTLTAMGTSVEVESDLNLNAIWNNSSNVHIRGSSYVYGQGVFRNLSDVTLYDTASLDPIGGIENPGRLRSFGSATRANLQHNAGLVEVVAGSTLWAPSFTSNSGTVQVDGTLEVGTSSRVISPPIDCSICEIQAAAITSGMMFNNLAGGVLSGNGSMVVDAGTGTVDNFGTIAPGSTGATGTFSIFGNLVMQSGSTVATDVLSTSSYDAVAVSGTAITGGSYAVTYLPGAFFAAGDTFSVLRAGVLDATTLPTVNVAGLVPQPSGNDLLLVATSAFPVAAPPPPPPPAAVPLAEQEVAEQQVESQVVTFANLFIQESQQQQEDEAKDNEIGKDDIVVTDTACKPS